MSVPDPVLDVVVPDDERPTGGSLYDQRLVAALRRTGHTARLVPVAGDWPCPDDAARSRLRTVLATHSPGRTVLLDGLLGCAAPEAVDDAVRSGVPVHVLVHLPLPAETGLDPAMAVAHSRREADALAAATGVVVTSSWAAADLRRRYGTEGAAVAAPGVDPAPPARGSRPLRLTCLGSLTPLKNQVLLPQILAPLVELGWTLDLVGSPGPAPYLRRLEKAVDEFPVPGRVRVRGPLVGEALEDQWAATDLLVLPSRAETYGMVVTEALARGIPALVPAGTGAVEALDGAAHGTLAVERAGAVLDTSDPTAWTRQLREWLTDAALRARWRATALARRGTLRPWEDTARDVLAAVTPDPNPRSDPDDRRPSS